MADSEVLYRAEFSLTDAVNDLEAAQEFLSEEDMMPSLSKYMGFHKMEDLPAKISSVEWLLSDEDSGIIEITAVEELTDKEVTELSDWIAFENGGNLGTTFEEQSFAHYEDDSDMDFYDDDDYDDGGSDSDWLEDANYITASFNTMIDDYTLEKVS